MFNFNGHLQELRSTMLSLMLLFSATLIGVVWVSVGLYHWLANCLGAVWGPILLGALFFLPIIIFALVNLFQSPPQSQPSAGLSVADMSVVNMSNIFESLSGRSPFLVAAAAIIAGFLASRFPALLSVFSQIVAAYAEDVKSRTAKDATEHSHGGTDNVA